LPDEPLVCVIDDDISVCRALVELVTSMGYRCSGHDSAEALLASVDAADAHCIVTDIHMPGLDGFGLKQQLASRGCRAKVIMITARTEEHLERRALAAGAICFLRKPLRADALAESLSLALGAP
jgi:FixJ family two-component response regulator